LAVLLVTVTDSVNSNGFYGDGALSTVNPSRVRLRFTSIVNISDLLGSVLFDFFLLVCWIGALMVKERNGKKLKPNKGNRFVSLAKLRG